MLEHSDWADETLYPLQTLKSMLDRVVLPRKGKLSKVNKALESEGG